MLEPSLRKAQRPWFSSRRRNARLGPKLVELFAEAAFPPAVWINLIHGNPWPAKRWFATPGVNVRVVNPGQLLRGSKRHHNLAELPDRMVARRELQQDAVDVLAPTLAWTSPVRLA